MTSHSYTTLSRAQLSKEYLHTNSTTHEFLFGALAELVDNARDANATKLSLFTLFDASLRGNYMLCFLDDGEGMDPSDTADIITFGRSNKRNVDDHMIGMYGNGLKSGSMRIGNDMIIFTKKDDTQTCLFLSRTFHDEEKIDEVIVPLPSFKIGSRNPIDDTEMGQERFAMEMDIILRYSPFKTDDDFFAQFDRIEGSSGTLVIVYNMKLLDNGDPELDILSDPQDIILTNPESDFDSDDGLMIERRSFRAYVAILYMDPRMIVYIQGKKVRTKKLAALLYKPKLYKYTSSRFKSRAESDAKKNLEEAKAAELKAKEAQSKAKDLESRTRNLSKAQLADLRRAQQHAAELKREAQLKRDSANRKQKALKEPKTMNLIFGINIDQRSHDGVFVYNCSRLIKMYEKVGPQTDGGVFCSGVVGIVNVPYYVLEPTHNKQDFADAKEYRHLLKAMGEHMVQYWKDLNIAQQGVLKFWESFGYVSQRWKDLPSHDPKFVRKRAMQINITLQCDKCLKWRTLPFSSNNLGREFSDEWVCSDNSDNQHNRCSAAEQKMNVPEGTLKKEIKSHDEKQKDLEAEIKKKMKLLEQMHKNRVVSSSRELQEIDRKKEAEERHAREEEEDRRGDEDRRREEQEERKKKERERKEREAEEKRSAKEAEARRKEKERAAEEKRKRKENEEKERQRRKTEEDRRKKKEQEEKQRQKQKAETKKEKAAVKRRTVVEEEEESEEEEIAPKRRRSGRPARQETPEPESEEEPTPRRGRAAKQTPKVEVNGTSRSRRSKSPVKDDEDDNDEDDGGFEMEIDNPEEDDISHADVGKHVEIQQGRKWHPATVVAVNDSDNKWKVKFDNNSKDKFDKWVSQNASSVRVTNEVDKTLSSPGGPQSPTSATPADTEAPSSSTGSGQKAQVIEDIANGYRTCLRYFLPPQWVMDKDSISGMTPQELSTFPLDDFFDHYEKGLRKLVNNFQTEASLRKQECEASQAKLKSVRKMIAKLLTSSNEEFNIDPECDGDQVDEFLLACLQASSSKSAEST
ncbi:ATPase MORC2-like isoform X2 [Mya arenaria]|uniref:ATPase MORC2-like isoform X2 n=1 Tax=Mya arenaria TaxID=6604 RepID=UPI0022DF2C06|nr:ATPase MORC2-like isoform X2 [Mya arenaria]